MDDRDAIIRALASELALSRKMKQSFDIYISDNGYKDNRCKPRIQFHGIGILATSIEFYPENPIMVDLNDQLLFIQTRGILGIALETVAITFSGKKAELVLGQSKGYRYESMQYVIAKAISRGIVKFAEEKGMKIIRVDQLEVPDPSVYMDERRKRDLLRY